MKNKTQTNVGFVTFLGAKDQRIDWCILLISCLVGYIIIRICYPYPNSISDAGTYALAARTNEFNIYRPFGYSLFMQIMHFFWSSIYSVFVFQMLVYFIATSIFAFSVKYFFAPYSHKLWRVLLFLFVFSPIHIFMANAVMSDILFSCLIYVLLASFLFVIKRNSYLAIAMFGIILYCALHTRYSAIIFPFVFIPFFFFLKGKIRWIAIAATLVVAFAFYSQMKSNMKETVMLDQFSTGFDGWQLASNAMNIVPFVDTRPQDIADPTLRSFHDYILQHNELILKETQNGTNPSYMFIWKNDYPLKKFMFFQIDYSNQKGVPAYYPQMWASLGDGLYKDYGKYIILHNPLKYMQYYYLPNAKQIFYPTKTGMIGSYNILDSKDVLEWYGIADSTNRAAVVPIFNDWVADTLSVLYLITWLVIGVLSALAIRYRKEIKWSKKQRIAWAGIIAFGIIYYTSTVFASPIEFRFWLSMTAVQFAFIYTVVNELWRIKRQGVDK